MIKEEDAEEAKADVLFIEDKLMMCCNIIFK